MDERFDTRNDPRFKKQGVKAKKIVLDERFKRITDIGGVLKDPKTGKQKVVKDEVDRIFHVEGKRHDHKSKGKRKSANNNRDLSSNSIPTNPKSDDDDDDDDDDDHHHHKSHNVTSSSVTATTITLSEESDKEEEQEEPEGFQWDALTDSSVSDSEAEDEQDGNETSIWDSREKDIPLGDESSRIAVLGCDWESMTSRDLHVLLSSFLSTGSIKRVAIYQSEFGKAREQYESLRGPLLDLPKEPATAAEVDDVDQTSDPPEEEKEEDEKVVQALRKYQKERSQYYYAVVECDSRETGAKLYDELEGVDFSLALDGLDMRFISDDTPPFTDTFPTTPRCEATGAPVKGYEPPAAFVSGLRHSKVTCTWDMTPTARSKNLRRLFNTEELAEMDLAHYLASEEDEEEDVGDFITLDDIELPTSIQEARDQKQEVAPELDDVHAYRRQLLGDLGNSESGVQMKVKSKKKVKEDKEEEFEMTIEDTEIAAPPDSWPVTPGGTVWENYLEKRKLQKKQRKQESRALFNDATSGVTDSFDKKKKKTTAFPLIGSKADAAIIDAERSKIELEILGLGGDNSSEEEDSKKTKKRKPKKFESDTDTHGINFEDDRFKELFTNPEMVVDTTNPKFKNGEVYKEFFAEKSRRKRQKNATRQ